MSGRAYELIAVFGITYLGAGAVFMMQVRLLQSPPAVAMIQNLLESAALVVFECPPERKRPVASLLKKALVVMVEPVVCPVHAVYMFVRHFTAASI
jgi:hypothetical protein